MTAGLVARMQGFGTTIFAEMTALATQLGAVNLGQGFPDSDGPPAMLERAVQAVRDGVNQYPPGPGMPALRTAISRQRQERYGLEYDPDGEVLVTVGATEAVSAALLALVEAGDEVLVLEPYYDSYAAAIALAGGVRRPLSLRPDPATGRFAFDPDDVRRAVNARTRVLLLNSPHNPTGMVLTQDELALLAEVCVGHDLVAITDEVYEYLTYDGVTHVPIASLPGMRERTVSISSAGKTFSVTGWKIGWICAPASLVSAVATVKQFLTFTASGPFQLGVAHAFEHELAWVGQQRASLQDRRDRLVTGLEKVGLTVHPAAGTYFVQTDVRSLGRTDGIEFARVLPHEAGVVGIPTAVFCDDVETFRPFVRFAFCKRDAVLDEATSRLTAYATRRPPGH